MKSGKSLRKSLGVAIAALGLVGFAASSARAQSDCLSAITLAGPLPATQAVNTTANSDLQVVSCITAGGSGGNDVWVLLPALTPGSNYVVETLGGSVTDTVLEVFATTAGCGGLSSIACDDDGGPGLLSSTAFVAAPATTYYVLAESWGAGGGTFSVRVADAPLAGTNDTCATATVIGALPYSNTIVVSGMTNTGEFDNDGAGSGIDAFWTFTPGTTQDYLLQGSNTDAGGTMCLGIWTGSCGALTQVVPVAAPAATPTVLTSLTSGTQYWFIYDDGFPGSLPNTVTVNFDVAPSAPANDLCGNATIVNPAALPFSDTVQMIGAGDEGFDNSGSIGAAGGGGSDVWYSFTPTASATYNLTCAGYDLGMGIYTGACGALVEVDAVDDTFGGELLRPSLASGTTYTIIVEGYSAADTGTLTFDLDGPFFPSANDTCATATVINPAALPYNDTVTVAFNSNSGEFDDDGAGSGVDAFWSFTPTVSQRYLLQGANTDAGGTMCVGWWTGACGALTNVGGVAGPAVAPIAIADMTSGTTYFAVYDDAFPGSLPDTASITVDVAPPPPANDLCAGATVINPLALPYADSPDLTFAGDEGLDNSASVGFGGGGGKDVFYSFTPDTTASYTIGADDQDTGIGIYTGACGALVEFGAVDDTFFGEFITIGLTSGTTYTIMPEGFDGSVSGIISFSVSAPIFPPANDLCASATVIPAAGPFPYTDSVDTAAAGDEGLDNSASVGFGGGGGKDVFYSFNPAVSASYSVAADGFDTGIGIFTGACGALSEVAAVDDFVGPESLLFTFNNGTPYTILVEGFTPADTGTLLLTVDGPFLAPANDLCGAAEALTLGVASTPVGLAAAGDEGVDGATPAPFVGGTGMNDVWYTFTPATTATFNVAWNEPAGAPAVSAFTGACGALTQVATTFVGSYDEPETSSLNMRMTSGTAYTILAETTAAGSAGTVTVTGPFTEPAGDTCATAIAQVGQGSTTVNVDDMVNDIINSVTLNILGVPADLGGRDAFFAFTVTNPGIHTFSVSGGADLSIALFSSNCASLNELTAADDNFPPTGFTPATYTETETITSPALTNGDTYYVVVDGFTWDDNTQFGDWTVTFTAPASVNDWHMMGN